MFGFWNASSAVANWAGRVRKGGLRRAARRLAIEACESRQMMAARSIDGADNNLQHPQWGSTDEQLLRIAPAEYGDRVSTPAGGDRLSAREISNRLVTHIDDATPSDRQLTAFLYVWGQFLDHDMDLTKSASPSEAFHISVPAGDDYFDPDNTGTAIIPLTRSIYDPTTGTSSQNPRQQINQITAWIDGSMVYGSDTVRAAALRTFVGGRLKVLETKVGDLPPLNTDNLPIANDAHRVPNTQLYLAGDIRSNENIELTSMHTLFLREHNRIADRIAAENPGLTDERIYQRARELVIGEIQAITYNQWIPAVLGASALRPYRGYNPRVNPSIANEFSTAGFRLHSTINDDVEFFDNEGHPIAFTYVNDAGVTVDVDGEVPLSDAFFNPTLFGQTGVDGILKYAASTHAEQLDTQLVESLRNFLFGQPGEGGLDLASLNIQRGRDHGLADYNATRAAYGLRPVTRFSQITLNPDLQAALREAYGNVNNIDLWVGALAEDHGNGAATGELSRRIMAEQFERLRDGDRFWYQRNFSGAELFRLERTRLSEVIERNTGVEGLQDNVFFFRAEISGVVFLDRNSDGGRDFGEFGISRVTVELLDDEGAVLDTQRTNRDGRYRFRTSAFHETGDYQVRVTMPSGFVATTDLSHGVSISAGDQRVGGVNFGFRPIGQVAADIGLPAAETLNARRGLRGTRVRT